MTLNTVEDGARALLLEAVNLVAETQLSFAVIGGWSPVLLNSSPIVHPGTRDVDLLFKRGTEPGALADVIRLFRSRQYFLSAKHPFQLLRVLEIAGTPLAFNVDLLHPVEGFQKAADLFSDHLEIDVRVTERFGHLVKAQSVATPLSAFIFDGHVDSVQVVGTLPNGQSGSAKVPIMDELGLVVTKSESVKSIKRTRDALDIFFATVQARDFDQLAKSARRLRDEFPDGHLALADLAARFADPKGKLHGSLVQSSFEHGLEEAVSAQLDLFRSRFQLLGALP